MKRKINPVNRLYRFHTLMGGLVVATLIVTAFTAAEIIALKNVVPGVAEFFLMAVVIVAINFIALGLGWVFCFVNIRSIPDYMNDLTVKGLEGIKLMADQLIRENELPRSHGGVILPSEYKKKKGEVDEKGI